MKQQFFSKNILVLAALLLATSCKKDFLELEPKGTALETNFYKTEAEIFQGLVATYDVLGWEGTDGWNMQLGLLNAASDDCYAGGSDASDQPNWVAWDNFSLNPLLGPQMGLWRKYYSGIYRANLLLQKIEEAPSLSPAFKARTIAELKFLRGWFYFDLVRLFGHVPLLTKTISVDDIYTVKQASPADIYAQIEKDLTEAKNTPELPETVPPSELGRITHGAVAALLGKVILFQNDNGRMLEAAANFEEVINSGNYFLTPNYGDIFKQENEFGPESVFEIQYASNRPGDYNCCFNSGPVNNATEGNYNIQFFGMRDYSGPVYAPGWSFCPVTPELVTFMQGDPRFQYTIIDGNALKQNGASYGTGYQNTDYFIKKYAPIAANQATDGEPALGWGQNIRAIRYADVLLMAAEAIARGGGNEATARQYLNQVRSRVALQPYVGNTSGQALLNAIYRERRLELATEGQRFWDLVRTGGASEALPGFVPGVSEYLPIPQQEIELSQGALVQNNGY
ncbi:MAG: RagB/SusD family nutrient uptake outer membrane protein [Bacteroidetes bacterium]|nr:RagB/SusD family nutrient uptake outer membrane protein [Bacteroidota bacterium]